jgi:methionyl-tRNA synthetase
VISFVRGGLQDLSISRTSFRWGIAVPSNPAHIIYVWLDALTNYITALGFPDLTGDYARFWPADLHMVGKDILRFHAVFWPAFLMAAGLAPPKRVFAHGWWTNEGQKISKSLGNVIDPVALIDRYGLDQVRYFLLREVPFGADGDFSHRALIQRINSELANELGNLAQRSLSMINKNCVAMTPLPALFTAEDQTLLDHAATLLPLLRAAFDRQLFHEGLEIVWQVVRAANGYVDRQAPWSLKTKDVDRMGTVLYVLAETVRRIALVLQPVMPESMASLLDQLAVPATERGFGSFDHPLRPGSVLPAPRGVFPREVMPIEGTA